MPMHEEKPWPRWQAALLLALAFLAAYSPMQLGNRELRWKEGFYGAMAQEMDLARPNTVAHGEVIAGEYPLYPWLTALVWRGSRTLGLPLSLELSLRLVSVLALAGIAAVAGYAGRRAVGGQAGMVAAAACITMLLPMEKALEGYPETLAVLWLLLGWTSWFSLGVAGGSWGRAWLMSLSCCGLAFYTTGWAAVFMFAFPLLWLRRPMSLWNRRPHLSGLLAGMCVLAGFVLLWGIPRWLSGGVVFRKLQIDPGVFTGGYVEQLVAFPVSAGMRLLPWAALAWPAFCAAYDPLDRNPLFSRYLRTILLALACVMWLNPYFRSRDLLVLVPLLALLTGHHYDLLVRRHGAVLHRLAGRLAAALALAAGGILLFYVVPPELWDDLPIHVNLDFRTAFRWQGLALGALAMAVAIYLALRAGRHPLWSHLLAACAVGMLCFWALFDPYRAQDREKADLGLLVRRRLLEDLGLPPDGTLPPGLTVFKGPRTQGLYNEGGYLGCPIHRLNRYQDLPSEAEAVYVLCATVPVHPARQWGVPLLRTNYAGRRLYLYKGLRARGGEEARP